MSSHGLTSRVVAIAVASIGALVFAEAPATEQAFVRGPEDTELQWGPCPPFMPAGCSIAVLHGDLTKPNADVLLRLPGKAVVPEHWHTSAERMVLIGGELVTSYKGQSPVVLKPGMYGYGPPKVPHTGSCVSATPCLLFVAFESAADAVLTEGAAK